jgi:hypothetical protein
VAIILTAKLVRWQGHTDIDNAALRANALVDENIPKVLDVWIVLRVLLDKLAIDEAELTLRGLVLVLLGSESQACVEALRGVIIRGIHFDDVFED